MDKLERPRKEDPGNGGEKNNIEVWEDLVKIKDLVKALIICTVTTFGAYLIAPKEPPQPLFFGLSGAIIGFIICAILIKPKRIVIETKEQDEHGH